MKLRFWYWAHDRAEALWHWIYYNRLPSGIAQRRNSEARQKHANEATIIWCNRKGEKLKMPE